MRRLIYLALVALLATVTFAIKIHTDNTIKTLTDTQLAAAIDSCIKHDLPQSADPYFTEAKRRAKAAHDNKLLLSLIDKQLSLNANRIETAENMLKAIDKEMTDAETPLTEMLMLRKVNTAVFEGEKGFWEYLNSRYEALNKLSAYEVADSAELIIPMSVYDYMMLAIHSSIPFINNFDDEMLKWRDNGTATSKILYEVINIDEFPETTLNESVARINKLAFSDETRNVAKLVMGFNYLKIATNTAKNMAISDAYADSAMNVFSTINNDLKANKKIKKLVSEYLRDINKKDIGVEVHYKQISPSQNIPISIYSRNVSDVDIVTYKLEGEARNFDAKKAEIVTTRNIKIPQVIGRIEQQNTYAELSPLPTGKYIIAVKSDSLEKYADFQVSDISAVTITTNEGARLLIRNAANGEPLIGAKVDGKQVDEYGLSAIINKGSRRISIVNGNDKAVVGVWSYTSNTKDHTSTRIQCVTDRKIYRPGQTLKYKVWVYSANSEKMWINAKSVRPTITITTHNGTKIYDEKLTTNEFGTASGEFKIPEDIDLGRASIHVHLDKNSEDAYLSVHIEEYKLSGNKIIFDPIREAYVSGDTVTTRGKAMSADNKPIAGAQIIINDSAKVFTDNEGRFAYSFATSKKEAYHVYEISAKMTDLAGETTEASSYINITDVGSNATITGTFHGDGDSLQLQIVSLNTNDMAYATQATYTIERCRYKYDYLPSRFFKADTIIGTPTYDIRQLNDSLEVVETIQCETVHVDSAYNINIPTKKWAAGIYRLKLEAGSPSGKKVGNVFVHKLMRGNGQCYDVLFLKNISKKFKPGGKVEIQVGSRLKDANIFIVTEYAGKIVDRRYVKCTGNIVGQTIAIPNEKQNYTQVNISAILVQKGCDYDKKISIDKDLNADDRINLSIESWRDKAAPQSQQTVTFNINDAARQSEICVSMYDKRLDRLESNKWNVAFYRNQLRTMLHTSEETIYFPDFRSGKDYFYYNFHDVRSLFTIRIPSFEPIYVVGYGRTRRFGVRKGLNKVMSLGVIEDSETMDCEVMDSKHAEVEMVAVEEEMIPVNRQEEVYAPMLPSPLDFEENFRTDFRETVFFYPHLRTNSEGNATFSFTLPDNITTYRLQAIAHDKQMNSGYLSKTLVVSKPLTVKAWLPRTVCEGDTISISMTATCDSACSNIIATLQVNDQTQKQTSATTAQQHTFRFTMVVPDGADSLRIAMSASNGKFSDGERHSLPVRSRYKEITESQSFILLKNGKHTLHNPFSSNDGELASSFSYTCNAWTEVLRALPHLHDCAWPSSDTYLGQVESSAIAMMLMKRTDVQMWVDSLRKNINSSILTEHNMEKNSPWVRFNTFQKQHDRDVVRMLSDNNSRKTYNSALRKLQKMQLSDGSFPWFSGMDGSEYITRHILSTLGMLLRYGMVNSSDVSEMCQKGQAYIERQITEEVERWERDKVKAPVADALMLHRLYTLSCLKGINTANAQLKRAIDAIPVASKMREPSSKLMAAIIYNRIGRTKEAQRLLQSVCENLVRPDEYTAHISLNGRAWYCNTTLVHSMLIMAMNELTPNNADQPRIINWLLREKRTTHWHDTQATSRAVLAMLTQSTDNRHTDIVSTANDSYNVTTELTLAPSPAEVKIDHTSPLVSWGNWQRTALLATDQMPANNSADISLVRTIDGGNKVGDKVTITLTITTAEDMDFVRISDYRPAAFEPIDQTSQYRGWWWIVRRTDGLVPHYFSPRDASVDFFVEHLPRGTHRFSYQCYVTNAGAMTAGYAEAVCMYIDGMDAHTEGRKLKVEN